MPRLAKPSTDTPCITLDEFFLLVGPEHAGKALTADWTATATDADGSDGESVTIPVMSPPLEMTLLLNNDVTDIDFGDVR